MAPAAKRKSPGEDEIQAKPAAKPRTKRQKTGTDLSTDLPGGIETPPPTPKPSAANGRRPAAAAKATKVNGHNNKNNSNSNQKNGTSKVASADVPVTNGILSHDKASSAAPAVRPLAGASKGRVIEDEDDRDDEDDEGDEHVPMTNGHINESARDATAASTRRSDVVVSTEQPGNQNGIKSEGQSEGLVDATLPAPATNSATTQHLNMPLQPNVNGNRHSLTPTPIDDTSNIRPTTEPVPPSLPDTKAKVKSTVDMTKPHNQLHEYCIRVKEVGDIWTVDELKRTHVIQDERSLLDACQKLVRLLLFVPMTLGRVAVYKTRSRDNATKISNLSINNSTIYNIIESTNGGGTWLKPLESKSNLHGTVVRRCLKELVALKLVKEIRSAETSKKVYIAAEVVIDEKHVGGSFMEESKYTEGIIGPITKLAFKYLSETGWYKTDVQVAHTSRHKSKADKHKPSKETHGEASSALNTEQGDSASTEALPERDGLPPWTRNGKMLIPQHPAYYPYYLTTADVNARLNENSILKDDALLNLKDTEQLLLKMSFDGQIERMRDMNGEINMREPRWRASKPTFHLDLDFAPLSAPVEPVEGQILPGNGLSQVPCARCPVKAKCKPGGVVNPEECSYLGDWLDF